MQKDQLKKIYFRSSHKKLERSADKISSDCLEAMIGAIYLDGGLKSVEKFIQIYGKNFNKVTITLIDSKTKLQEFSLKKFKELPKYVFFKKTGPQHRLCLKLKYKFLIQKKLLE